MTEGKSETADASPADVDPFGSSFSVRCRAIYQILRSKNGFFFGDDGSSFGWRDWLGYYLGPDQAPSISTEIRKVSENPSHMIGDLTKKAILYTAIGRVARNSEIEIVILGCNSHRGRLEEHGHTLSVIGAVEEEVRKILQNGAFKKNFSLWALEDGKKWIEVETICACMSPEQRPEEQGADAGRGLLERILGGIRRIGGRGGPDGHVSR